MAEKKRKMREERVEKKRKKHLPSKTLKAPENKMSKKRKKDDGRRKKGPHLPSALRKKLDLLNRNSNPTGSEESNGSDEEEVAYRKDDVYEYDEPIPQEESKKNNRFDRVDNLEYELPDEFEDENVASSSDDDGDDSGKGMNEMDSSDESKLESEEYEDDDRHVRMLQGITGMPRDAFENKKRKKVVVSEAYPENEYNLSRESSGCDGRISIHDLLDPLHGKSGYSKLRTRMNQLESSRTVPAPLPKADQERLERKATYELSKKDITKWEPLVKRNREAPTIYFDEDIDLGYSTIGAIAAEFEPRTKFEKKIASVVNNAKVLEAHNQDGAKLLELNKISVEDVKDRQNRLAKMRSLLFRHELKAKHIKKIKSKTFHRMLKKDRLKAAASLSEVDPEAAKEYAIKQEFKRAEERMTLKHKNSSKWAKRILKRGLKVQDEGTRTAISEQLHQHALLARKMNSMKGSSSSDDSSDEDENDESTDSEEPTKFLTRAKEKTLKIMEEDDEMPKTGVLSLPFMVRGMKKRKEAACEEAQLALQEYESSLKQLEDSNERESPKQGTSSGRRVFGAVTKQLEEAPGKDIDSENDFEPNENVDFGNEENISVHRDVQVDPGILLEESENDRGALFKSFDDITKEPRSTTTYEVALFASDTWKKMQSGREVDGHARKPSTVVEPPIQEQDPKEVDQNSDSESEEEMVDGILSSGATREYELPSQTELIRSAFVGDDVEEEFEKDKLDVLNKENPEPEKPVLLPGWGQWTHIQQKKGLPSWMLEEHEHVKKKREDALKKRKDANLKHVIISEKIDKKADKLLTKTLPFPFTSKEVFEQSVRMPIGPEFNPATSVGALNRPAVVKRPGIIIKPIKFEEVNPHEKANESRDGGQVTKVKSKVTSGKSVKKTSKGKKS